METSTLDSPATSAATSYAGFGQRLLAFIIDGIIIGIVYTVVLTPIMTVIGLGIASEAQNMSSMTEDEAAAATVGMVGSILAVVGTAIIAIYAIQLLYYSIMESSKLQASVGKLAMGIKVVDLSGNRISFGTAFIRAIGKVLSGMIMYIGYLMAAFTEKKQGLHDMIASTLVVKK
jgi:uncharacterized RDD family membrane protein YckC